MINVHGLGEDANRPKVDFVIRVYVCHHFEV